MFIGLYYVLWLSVTTRMHKEKGRNFSFDDNA